MQRSLVSMANMDLWGILSSCLSKVSFSQGEIWCAVGLMRLKVALLFKGNSVGDVVL